MAKRIASAELRLLGAFGLTAADGSAVAFGSPRAQVLLAYLAMHRDERPARRDVAFLLWPDSSEAQARNNLRQLLHQVRLGWPDADRIIVSNATVLAVPRDAALVLDVDAFEAAVDAAADPDPAGGLAAERAALEHAANLYAGDLLPGADGEWITPERERLAARHRRLLDRLIGVLEQGGDYRAAIERGRERLRIDPLDERTYRWLMRLHALDRDRAGALRVYRECASVLEAELGVEPEPATRQLYERIAADVAGAVGTRASAGSTEQPADSSARSSAGRAVTGGFPLVGRRDAWAALMRAWDRVVPDEAHLVAVSGEAGIGKSRLAAEACDWAARQGVASSSTRAWAAEGRLAYAPVADWLRSVPLVSSLPRLEPGSLSEISRVLPELLVQRPDLPRPSPRIEDWHRQAFFEAVADAFVAAPRPMMLVLDDLQWCDADTLEWLHFLLRTGRTPGLLVIGTMRPEEVDHAHPAARLLAALRDAGQSTQIDLGPLDAAETAELAASVAGRALRPGVAREIHAETEGNPLFVVETVRAGLAAGEPARAPAPRRPDASPAAGQARSLPPKVQAVIAARLDQLSRPARDLASLAATVGRAFSLDVVRASGDASEEALVAGLDELLDRRLIREQPAAGYDFAHDKIREVAYGTLTAARRRLLHRRVAEGLLVTHPMGRNEVAAQVAWHYALAGQPSDAADYYGLAAEDAQRLGANLEAIALLGRGLDLLSALPPGGDRDARELGLQTALGASLVATEGYGSSAVGVVYERCRELSERLGRPLSPPILRALAIAVLAKVRIDECYGLGQQLLEIAERDDDPILRVEGHYVLAMALQLGGEIAAAGVELEAALLSYDRSRSSAHVGLYSQDPAVVCLIRHGVGLWLLGEAEASARRRAESLALARELGHPFSLGYALTWDAVTHAFAGEVALARSQAEAAIELGSEHRLPFWVSFATTVRGWTIAEQGDVGAGLEEIERGMAAFVAIGSRAFRPFQLSLHAEELGRAGSVERGLEAIRQAIYLGETTQERWTESMVHRVHGDLLSLGDDPRGAEAAYERAIEVARRQGTRPLEARARARLSGLQVGAGRPAAPPVRPAR